jgi:hypothetical protein
LFLLDELRDFSTDASNSALIVNNEVSATPCHAVSACPAANEKTKKGFPSHRDWLTRERT